jgi:glycerol-3-phosphate dehydrogenase
MKLKEDYIGTRPAKKPFREMDWEERARAIEENPKYGQIICRCETVTEAEILSAIHSPLPVTTLDGVKRR